MQRSISIGDISSIDKGSGLHVFASFSNNAAEGPPIRFMLDTGSTGFVVGKKNLQPAQYRLTQDKFRLVYTSSGNTYDGHWVIVSVNFYSSKGGSAVGAAVARTVPMRVRLAETFTHGGTKEVDTDPGTVMLGIGFDRDTGSGLDPGGNYIFDDINPFLMIDEMQMSADSANMVPGFILTPTSIMLGITPEDREEFASIQLVRQAPTAVPAAPASQTKAQYPPNKPQWAAPNITLAVPSANIAPMLATLLMDTGIDYTIVQAPLGIAPPQSFHASGGKSGGRVQVADGQEIVISLPGLGRPLYTYKVGDVDAGAPVWVMWRHNIQQHNGVPFVNTGMHAMSAFDYMYDDEKGRLGFRFREKS